MTLDSLSRTGPTVSRHVLNSGQTRSLFAARVTPYWRGRLIGDIRRGDVVVVLDRAEDTSIYRANAVLAAVRKLFNWAVLRGLIEVSPIVPGMARPGHVNRDRYLTFEELRLVWRAAGRLGQPFGPIFKLLLLTGQRRGEVVRARWSSMDLEQERLWSLSPDETKAGRAHLVPLTEPALEILRAQPLIDEEQPAEGGGHIFTTTGRTPVSGMSKAKRHLDAARGASRRRHRQRSGSRQGQGAPAMARP